jgi:hypothetical protein
MIFCGGTSSPEAGLNHGWHEVDSYQVPIKYEQGDLQSPKVYSEVLNQQQISTAPSLTGSCFARNNCLECSSPARGRPDIDIDTRVNRALPGFAKACRFAMKEEDKTDGWSSSTLDNSSLDQFRSSLSQFSFDSPPKAELRRSPRKPTPVRSRTTGPVKRLASESFSLDVKEPKISSPQRSPKKQKRSYAPPETYAHLRELQDHLKSDLDG